MDCLTVNYYTSWLLLPIRLCLLAIISVVGLAWLVGCWFRSVTPSDSFFNLWISYFLFYLGVTVTVIQDHGYFGYGNLYRTNQFVTVFNHSHPLDLAVLTMTMKRPLLGTVPATIESRWWYQLGRPLLANYLLPASKEKLVTRIANHFQSKSPHCLVVAARPSRQLRQLVAYQGQILPVAIRYVASQTQLQTITVNNWYQQLFQLLTDGHLHAWVQFLPTEFNNPYYDDDGSQWVDLLQHQLRRLPAPSPPRLLTTQVTGFSWSWLGLVLLTATTVSPPHWRLGTILTAGTTWLSQRYPSNNTALLDHLAYRTVQLLLVSYWVGSICEMTTRGFSWILT